MRRVKLNRRRQMQLHFDSLFNKKSDYLKNLVNVRTDGIKEIENEKVNILIDKCLGINQFDRNYGFFSPSIAATHSKTKDEPKKPKLRLFPELKVLITSPNERENPDRYKPKDYIEDEFSNIYKNKNYFGEKNNNKLFGSYKPINRNRNRNTIESDVGIFYSKNENKENSFLSGIGRNIMLTTIEKEDLKTPNKKKQIFNQISLTDDSKF